ncbi:putative ABC transporter ATP-binding protein [Sphingobium sp. SYK-6]|uniref:ABC transporter ATP-binding protein n=1 Tax=Sphingobium sp. (strain NBRC 103272 / SYK-6) TaxID=627192 RepID=UPI0002277543|nr:ATP-binding cassette domain-containing protein [Sphingobium sp. SYK-6]BAK66087.1 putative ABC transporter ATP-binding protein [Sphingobium sp. SYK-6]
MILSISGLSHGFADRPVLRGFALDLARGEHMLLLGPSGSGKTTLINAVAGLLTPDEGVIAIEGEVINQLGAAERDRLRRRRIGIIFQSLRLVSALSVRDNLRLAQRLSGGGVDEAAIAALLDQVGIGHRADAKPRALSQGEAQRAAIARALVGKPALLIADEPTSALDDTNAERVARLLLETADHNGSTLLVATHDARLKAFIPRSRTLAPALSEAA